MEKPRIDIEYCPRCGWMLRAAWLAQELLTTFSEEVSAVALVPSAMNGTCQVSINGALVWCRKTEAGFPQAAELKQRVRDRIAPHRALGHADKADAKDT
jgi:selenoprotein W-related protein